MLVQSGRPVGVMQTHEWAPRVLIANSNLVGDWANWEEFRRLEALGLTMYGQMTAGSWIYIGTQGILQGTYETFAAVAAKKFGGTLAGHDHPHRRTRRHGRRPAARRHHERRRRDLHRRRPARHRAPHRAPLPGRAGRLPRARAPARRRGPRRPPAALHRPARQRRRAAAAACSPRARPIDIVTDQTSRPRPAGLPARRRRLRRHGRLRGRQEARRASPQRARESMARHVEAMVGFMDAGAEVFDYGNSIRGEAQLAGYERAFAFPGFVPAYIRPLFCEGKGPFRWAALSGDARGHRQDRQGDPRPLPGERVAAPLDQAGRRAGPLPGPARPHLLARLRRARQGRRAVQRHGRRAASWPPRWPSAATTSTAAPSPPRTARPRPCSTAPTRSPTGRC